ncbi:MAG: lysophospholipid acyltransferase family protein [Pleomorphochaeta sp.]
MSKEKPIFIRFIAKPLYKTFYLNPRVRIIKEDGGLLDKIKGPAIIVGNHCHSLDPMFVYAEMKPHVRWVAGAYLFKTKFVGFVVEHLAMCIPKQQGRSDLKTIKTISSALKANTIVGLFPEGTRTWDGDSYDLDHKATAKMLRIFKVPVYFLSLEGAYDLHPRWADEKRRGLLVIRLKKVLTTEELKTKKLDELIQITKENLSYNHEEWQNKTKRPFSCKNRAHGIQRLLYVCPKCHSIQTIIGKKHSVICTACNTEDILTEQTLLEKGTFGFSSLAKWNSFQQKYIKENLITYKNDKGDFFKKGVENRFEMISKNYDCLLNPNELRFSLDNGKTLVFELCKIESMILSVKQSIEFYYENQLYSFRLQPKLNSLKYVQQWEAANARI